MSSLLKASVQGPSEFNCWIDPVAAEMARLNRIARDYHCHGSRNASEKRATRYQHGSVELEERKKGPAVWVYRWWEEGINGMLLHRKHQIGTVEEYLSESAAQAAADSLRFHRQ